MLISLARLLAALAVFASMGAGATIFSGNYSFIVNSWMPSSGSPAATPPPANFTVTGHVAYDDTLPNQFIAGATGVASDGYTLQGAFTTGTFGFGVSVLSSEAEIILAFSTSSGMLTQAEFFPNDFPSSDYQAGLRFSGTFTLDSSSPPEHAIPLPPTSALLGVGFLALFWRRRDALRSA